MKSLSNISRTQLNSEKLMMLLETYEQKGREYYYDRLFEKDSDIVFRNTFEEDIYYLGQIMRLDFTDHKLKLWSRRNFSSKTKDETQFNNYKAIIRSIRRDGKRFEMYNSVIIDLSKLISKNIRRVSVNTDEVSERDILNPTSRRKKTLLLEELIKLYNEEIDKKNHETISVILNFYIDFINMDIFSSYNEEMGLFLLYALLLKYFSVFKYVSFFKHFNENIKNFNQGLLEAKYNWQEGYSNSERLYLLLIDILQDSYKELQLLAHRYEFERDLAKGDHVEATILKGKEIFTKSEIRKLNPLVSDSTIERTLRRLKEEGIIRPLGTGRSASWQLVEKNNDFKLTQLDLFSETDFD